MSVGAIDAGARWSRWFNRWAAWVLVLLLLAGLPALRAAEVSGYLPLNLEPRLEADVLQMLTLADQPVMRRPIPLAAITAALPRACEIDETLCMRVQRSLAPWMGRAALGMASFEAAVATAAKAADSARLSLPNARGQPLDAGWQVAVGAYAQLGDHVRVNAGAVAHRGRASPGGSYISVGGGRAQIDVGYRDRWWSPMRDTAMLVSTQAPTIASATISNSVPLTRAKFSYEAFVGRLSQSDRIQFQGGFTTGHPLLTGVTASLQPVPGWSISGSRLVQFGGGQRSGSARDVLKVLLNGTGNAGVGTETELGNEQVAVATQLTVPGTRPMSVYMEYAAEDTFHSQSYRFGNGALSAGLYLPRFRPDLQLRYEFSNWEDVWYVHHLYRDGLRNDGHVLGNWGADWRRLPDSVGGQSHMLALDWDADTVTRYGLVYRTAQNASYSGGHYRRAHLLQLTADAPWRQFDLALSLQGGVDPYGGTFGRLAATLTVSGDARNTPLRTHMDFASDSGAREVAKGVAVERFVEAGLSVGQLRYEKDSNVLPAVTTREASPHVGFGIRRAVTQRGDIGARLELDRLAGRTLLALRALDYRYRMGTSWAATGFFGFARYDALTPAHGYYLGAGMQRREIRPGWDLNLEARYLDRIVRKKLTPGEVSIVWPNEFWSMLGGAVSLSRRF